MTLRMPFDPMQRSREVEQIVMQGNMRLYYRFRFAKFYGGIVTADAIGCNLLCAYCWNYSRNMDPSRFREYYSPSEVADRLLMLSKKHGCDQFRISGAEPILGETSALHLAEVIRQVAGRFIIETNGVMLGAESSIINILETLSDIHVRLCVKAHNGPDFEKITGAKAEGFDYQLLAIERLRKASINCSIAMMAPFVDPNKLPCHVHEIEDLILYKSTEKNLRQRGF